MAQERAFNSVAETGGNGVVEGWSALSGKLEGEVGLEEEWGDVVRNVLAVVVEEAGRMHESMAGRCEWVKVVVCVRRGEQSMEISSESYGHSVRWPGAPAAW